MSTARLTWLGHPTFLLETAEGPRVLLDCFVDSCPTTPAEFHGTGLGDLDAILLTHGHTDHVADVVAHQQRTGAKVAGMVELMDWFASKGGLTPDDVIDFNKGGTIEAACVQVTMTHAQHSSSTPDGSYAGEAAGLVVRLADGFTIYHAGDTNVFGDMALIRELYAPDLAILPIGGHYTMGPREAALAIDLLQVDQVIGCHWGTFPPLAGRPAQLAALVPDNVTVHQLEPGDSIDLVR